MATLGQVLRLTLETKMMGSEQHFTERQQHKEAKRAGEGVMFQKLGMVFLPGHRARRRSSGRGGLRRTLRALLNNGTRVLVVVTGSHEAQGDLLRILNGLDII